jgi:hypothetical protein
MLYVPLVGLPPVPIVVERHSIHKLSIGNLRAVREAKSTPPAPFVTMKKVKYQALRHGRQFAKHVLPAVVKPARTLWNEVIGFLFFCLAVIFGFNGVRAYMNNEGAKLLLAAPLALVMGWFAVTSFLRARKISRS